MDPELLEQAAQRWDSLAASGVDSATATRQVTEWLASQPGSGLEQVGPTRDPMTQPAVTPGEPMDFRSAVASSGRAPQPGTPLAVEPSRMTPAAELAPASIAAPRSVMIAGLGVPGGRAEAVTRGGIQGATFETGDEISAGIRSIGPAIWRGGETGTEAFRRNVADIRAKNEASRSAYPWTYGAGQMAGGVATNLGAGTALQATSRGAQLMKHVIGPGTALQTIPRVAALGAAEGGLAGFGMAEGSPGERMPSAIRGAEIGAVASPLFYSGARGLGAAGGRVMDIAGVRPAGATSGAVGQLAQGLGVKTMDERAADRMSRPFRQRRMGRAGRKEAERVADEAVEQIEGAATRGTPLSYMDISEETRGITRGARSQGGQPADEISDFLHRRVEGQVPRLEQHLSSRTNVVKYLDGINEQRSLESAPLYKALEPQSVSGAELGGYLNRPNFRRVYRDVSNDVLNRGEAALPKLDDLIDADGNLLQALPFRVVDNIKKGLDNDLYLSGRNLSPAQIRDREQARVGFLRLLDSEIEGYAEARAVYQGHTAIMEAYEDGLNLFKKNELLDITEARFNNLDPGQQEAYRLGAVESLMDKAHTPDPSRNIAGARGLTEAPNDLRRLRLMFEDDASFNEFRAVVGDQDMVAVTKNWILGGSQTVDKALEAAEHIGVDITQAATGGISGIVGRWLKDVAAKRAAGYSTRLAEAMVPDLTATGPAAVATVRRLQGHRGDPRRGTPRAIATSGAVGQPISTATIGPELPRDDSGQVMGEADVLRRQAERRVDELFEQGLSVPEIQEILNREGLGVGPR